MTGGQKSTGIFKNYLAAFQLKAEFAISLLRGFRMQKNIRQACKKDKACK